MIPALCYATVISLILAVVLAVWRDVPVLHVFLPIDHSVNLWRQTFAAGAACVTIMAGLAMWGCWYGPPLLAAGWIGGLAFPWWCAIWHLRQRR